LLLAIIEWPNISGLLLPVHKQAMSFSLSPAAVEGFVPRLAATIRVGLAQWERAGAVSLMEAVRYHHCCPELQVSPVTKHSAV
jgi:hypothetical protein